MKWYYSNNDEKRGPVSDDEFQALVSQGVITSATMIRSEDAVDWAPYSEGISTTPPASAAGLEGGIVCGMCGCGISASDSFVLSGVSYCLACKPQILQRVAEGRSITEPVSRRPIVHRVALISLSVVAARSIIGQFQFSHLPLFTLLIGLPVGLAIWSLLLWKIWKRPRGWGLGVGIFLFLIIAFQSYLWWLGIHNPQLARFDFDRSTVHFILRDELPIFIAGLSCILLRFLPPKISGRQA